MKATFLSILLLITAPAVAADEYIIGKTVACESSGRPYVWGDDHTSFGIAQFQWQTFKEFRQRAGMPWLRWKSPEHQLILMRWMFDAGFADRWTCWRLHHRKWEQEERHLHEVPGRN